MTLATAALAAGFACLAEHLGQTATLVPDGTGTPVAITLVVGQPTSTVSVIEVGGLADDARAEVTIGGAAALAAALGRGVHRGDQVVIAAGQPHSGTWIVERTVTHQGDLLTASVRDAGPIHAAGPGVVEVT